MSSRRTASNVLTLALLGSATFVVAATYAQQPSPQMSFFITSVGSGRGANLGGLQGADAHCAMLAKQAGAAGNRTWRAYLSTQQPAGNARDRIGTGPWYNAKGVMIAKSVEDLHSDKNNLTKETQLTEKGTVVNGRGDTPNMHDILTGSGLDGRAVAGGDDTTCNNWTSDGDRQRHGRAPRPPGRRRQPVVVELRARVEGLQPGEPGGHRRQRLLLLLRRQLTRRRAGARPRLPPREREHVRSQRHVEAVRPAVALLAAARAAVGSREQVPQARARRACGARPAGRARQGQRTARAPRSRRSARSRASARPCTSARNSIRSSGAGTATSSRLPGVSTRAHSGGLRRALNDSTRSTLAVADRQAAVGVGDDPGEGRCPPRRAIDRVHGDVDADAAGAGGER